MGPKKMVLKFEVVSGRINIGDARHEHEIQGSNLWSLKARNGTWTVEAPEGCDFLRATHSFAYPATADDHALDTITIESGMISITDSGHHSVDDADALQEMIDDDFGHDILMPHGILMATKHKEDEHYVYAKITPIGELTAIYIDLDPYSDDE